MNMKNIIFSIILISVLVFASCSNTNMGNISNIKNLVHKSNTQENVGFNPSKPLTMQISVKPTKIYAKTSFTLNVGLLNTGDDDITKANLTLLGIDPSDFGSSSSSAFSKDVSDIKATPLSEIEKMKVSDPMTAFGSQATFNLDYTNSISNPVDFDIFVQAIFPYKSTADMTFCVKKNLQLSTGCSVNDIAKQQVSNGYISVSTPMINVIKDTSDTLELEAQFTISKAYSDVSLSGTDSFNDKYDSFKLSLPSSSKSYFKLTKAYIFGRNTEELTSGSISNHIVNMSQGQAKVNLFFQIKKNSIPASYDYAPIHLTFDYYVKQKVSQTIAINPEQS